MGVAIVVALASAGILSGILDAITGLIAEYGYPAVFAAAFLEVIFPPVPSEVIFPLVGFTAQNRGLGLENAIGMASVGALGSIAVFTARMIPGIREIISIPAGIGQMNFAKFVGYTFAGSLLWCIILTLTGYYLGEAWSKFSEQVSYAFTIVSFIVIAVIIAGVGFWYSRHKRAP